MWCQLDFAADFLFFVKKKTWLITGPNYKSELIVQKFFLLLFMFPVEVARSGGRFKVHENLLSVIILYIFMKCTFHHVLILQEEMRNWSLLEL